MEVLSRGSFVRFPAMGYKHQLLAHHLVSSGFLKFQTTQSKKRPRKIRIIATFTKICKTSTLKDKTIAYLLDLS
jgi:hypothetical protein